MKKQPGTDALADRWREEWPRALAVWSKFTRLRSPLLCGTDAEARREGLDGSFAMIRLHDQAIVVNLEEVLARGLGDYGVEILAHEIGHHILAPATLTEHARTLARMRKALPMHEAHAPMIANLYTDLLINDRLQRGARLRLVDIYQKIKAEASQSKVWNLYMRIYEILWSLRTGTLGIPVLPEDMEGDAVLGARLIRSFASEWLRGSGRFAALMLPYVMEDQKASKAMRVFSVWSDTKDASIGGMPTGLTDEDPAEQSENVHPAEDEAGGSVPADSRTVPGGAAGQARQPFEYGEILRSAGIKLEDHEVAVRYYRERARKHLLPFPRRKMPESQDPLPEGLEPWEMGESLDAIDWMQTILQSPRVIPGVTTVQRIWGLAEGTMPGFRPFDLDLYVDSSGSMLNPQRQLSYPALAGAILCLSALRAGARVQVTLWSGKQQFLTTDGFIQDEDKILKVLTGYFGGGTAFPLHILRVTYLHRRVARMAHVMVVSDDGVTTMFDSDERGASGWDIAGQALAKAGGGGSLVLNLPAYWDQGKTDLSRDLCRAREEQGWDIYPVGQWEELTSFAREFSRRHYHPKNEETHR
ncbi:MAG: VWA domain-containing protein [Verrucomicrobiae bacterium]|nr:VWA domain-containing protein [Verrucomicrobiae bacterium]